MKKLIILVILFLVVGSFFILDFDHYFSLSYIKTQQQDLLVLRDRYPVMVSMVYFVGYVVLTACSLPGAVILTLLGGALFGFFWGSVLVSFASSLGATIAFLLARFVLRDWVRKKAGHRLRAVQRGVEKDGALYLFSLRLIPVVPFFLVNILMALTPIRSSTFYLVSQLGMLAGTLVYINLGKRLAQIDSLTSVISPELFLAFTLLGLFPFLTRWFLHVLRTRLKDKTAS